MTTSTPSVTATRTGGAAEADTDICEDSSPRVASSTAGTVSREAYHNNENCGVLLRAPAGQVIRITFTSVSTEGCCDFVTVYDGTTAAGPQLVGVSGTAIPAVVTSTTNNVFVRWVSDSVVTGDGFSFTYVAVAPRSNMVLNKVEEAAVRVTEETTSPAWAWITAVACTSAVVVAGVAVGWYMWQQRRQSEVLLEITLEGPENDGKSLADDLLLVTTPVAFSDMV